MNEQNINKNTFDVQQFVQFIYLFNLFVVFNFRDTVWLSLLAKFAKENTKLTQLSVFFKSCSMILLTGDTWKSHQAQFTSLQVIDRRNLW